MDTISREAATSSDVSLLPPAPVSSARPGDSVNTPAATRYPESFDPALYFEQRERLCADAKTVLAEKRASHGLRHYYAEQTDIVEFQRAVDASLLRGGALQGEVAQAASEAASAASMESKLVDFAINASTAANVLLLILKVTASVFSGSVAVVASTVDSVLDIMSGMIVWYSSLLSSKRDSALFPVGKSRFEPVTIIIFSCVMGFASISLIREGVSTLEQGPQPPAAVPLTIGILVAVVFIKAILYFICARLADVSPSCSALSVDHLNDVCTNTATLVAVGIATSVNSAWWLDPAACIILSSIILIVWARTGREQFMLLSSSIAEPSQIARLTYIALTSDAKFVDTIVAYSLGSRLQVECDIVLPPEMPLTEAHDIGEALTLRLEKFSDVERAFVHIDTEFDHSRSIEHVDPYSRR